MPLRTALVVVTLLAALAVLIARGPSTAEAGTLAGSGHIEVQNPLNCFAVSCGSLPLDAGPAVDTTCLEYAASSVDAGAGYAQGARYSMTASAATVLCVNQSCGETGGVRVGTNPGEVAFGGTNGSGLSPHVAAPDGGMVRLCCKGIADYSTLNVCRYDTGLGR